MSLPDFQRSDLESSEGELDRRPCSFVCRHSRFTDGILEDIDPFCVLHIDSDSAVDQRRREQACAETNSRRCPLLLCPRLSYRRRMRSSLSSANLMVSRIMLPLSGPCMDVLPRRDCAVPVGLEQTITLDVN